MTNSVLYSKDGKEDMEEHVIESNKRHADRFLNNLHAFPGFRLLRSDSLGNLMIGRRSRAVRLVCTSSYLGTVRDDNHDRKICSIVIIRPLLRDVAFHMSE